LIFPGTFKYYLFADEGVSNFYLLFINFKATLISNLRRVYKLLDTPPIEELLFRWVLLKPIVDLLGVKMGVISSALIFSFSHLDPWNIISPFLVGLAAGWIVARNGSIISAIIIHGVHNTISHLVNMFIVF
jgi:hypothetical protein